MLAKVIKLFEEGKIQQALAEPLLSQETDIGKYLKKRYAREILIDQIEREDFDFVKAKLSESSSIIATLNQVLTLEKVHQLKIRENLDDDLNLLTEFLFDSIGQPLEIWTDEKISNWLEWIENEKIITQISTPCRVDFVRAMIYRFHNKPLNIPEDHYASQLLQTFSSFTEFSTEISKFRGDDEAFERLLLNYFRDCYIDELSVLRNVPRGDSLDKTSLQQLPIEKIIQDYKENIGSFVFTPEEEIVFCLHPKILSKYQNFISFRDCEYNFELIIDLLVDPENAQKIVDYFTNSPKYNYQSPEEKKTYLFECFSIE